MEVEAGLAERLTHGSWRPRAQAGLADLAPTAGAPPGPQARTLSCLRQAPWAELAQDRVGPPSQLRKETQSSEVSTPGGPAESRGLHTSLSQDPSPAAGSRGRGRARMVGWNVGG